MNKKNIKDEFVDSEDISDENNKDESSISTTHFNRKGIILDRRKIPERRKKLQKISKISFTKD